jgi:hypothetical protein
VANYRFDGKPDFEKLRVFKAYVRALKHEIKLLYIKIHLLSHRKHTTSKDQSENDTRKIVAVVQINNMEHTNIREVRLLLMLEQVANTVTMCFRRLKIMNIHISW